VTIKKQVGFTLLEVLIAMVLMAFLSIFTSRSINTAIHSKEKIQRDMDKYATLRDALKVIERDINNAFNYQDFNAQLFNLALKERATRHNATAGAGTQPPINPQTGLPYPQNQNPQNQQTTPANGVQTEQYKPKPEYNYTGFVGEKTAIDFTSLSNVRMNEDSQVSNQAEIGYKLKGCRRRSQQNASSNCLWRRVAPIMDDDLLKGGEETVLIENVEKFELRYLGPGKEKEWVDTWITTERGDALTKGKFPYAVEVTIEILDKSPNVKDKPLRMTLVAAIRNPNNPPPVPTDPNNPGAVPNANTQQTR
jgi:prepilin-type N-terminal cleavage/methylation domain-containing protein